MIDPMKTIIRKNKSLKNTIPVVSLPIYITSDHPSKVIDMKIVSQEKKILSNEVRLLFGLF